MICSYRQLKEDLMKADQLQKHIYATYACLRFGLATIAIFFPVIIYGGGRLYGINPQDTMSAYYFATPPGSDEPHMRVWFVGLLFAISVCLILYRGFSRQEDIVFNFAGLFGLGVALFPMAWECGDQCPIITVHGVCAFLLFCCVAYVSFKCAPQTLHLIEDPQLRNAYLYKYQINGALMVLSPLSSFVLTQLIGAESMVIFFIEAFGIWAFAYYWWTKGRELLKTQFELKALQGKIS